MTRVTHLASRHAAPTPPTMGMALHYLRQPASNVPGAARKAVQALAALRSLDTVMGVQA